MDLLGFILFYLVLISIIDGFIRFDLVLPSFFLGLTRLGLYQVSLGGFGSLKADEL